MIFEGCSSFRTRIILSLLSGKPVKIKNIRSQENEPGLKGSLFYLSFYIINYWKNV